MRTSIAIAAAACLTSLPAFAEAHCAGAGPTNEMVIAVSVQGDFKACMLKLMEGAKTKCSAGSNELKLTVTGSENGKDADLRVIHVDCPSDGGKVSRPAPPGQKK